MKKVIYICVVFLFFIAVRSASSQTIIAQENFTNYQGNTGTVPVGWFFSYHGFYTTTTFSGISGPNSYKFGVNNATVTAPKFAKADSVKFWIKGSGVDTISTLVIFESTDSIVWDTLVKINHLPTTAATGKRNFPVKSTSKYIKFKYLKSVGNLAFDDFKLLINASNINFTANFFTGCAPLCTGFTATSTTPIKSYQWDLGLGFSNLPQPTQCYSNGGSYTVKLTVVDTFNNVYSLTKTNYITVYGSPVVDFIFSPSSIYKNTTVNFTNTSLNSTSWTWLFYDPNDPANSNLQNPTHVFTDTGTYCPVLVAQSSQGCIDTVKHCLKVLPGTVSIKPIQKNEVSINVTSNDISLKIFFTEQAMNEFQIVIYNLMGELMVNESGNSDKEYNIVNWSNGIYLIDIISDDRRISRKIFITK